MDSPRKSRSSLLSSSSSMKPTVLGESKSLFPLPQSPLITGRKRVFDSDVVSPTRSVGKHPAHRPTAQQQGLEDRFIPNRAKLDEDSSHYAIMNAESQLLAPSTPSKKATPAQQRLKQELSTLSPMSGKRIIDCRKSLTPVLDRAASGIFTRRESLEATGTSSKPPVRSIPSVPKRVLDIPQLVNDYYLNLLHWGSNNVLAVALGPTAYVWHAESGQVDSLLTLEEEEAYISSVQWSPDSKLLAVGTTLNTAYLYDIEKETIHRELEGHTNRIAALSWQNNHILTTGGRDSAILNHDIRMRRSLISSYTAHNQEICGLAWSPDETALASGGNDNMLCLWDARMSERADSTSNIPRLQDITANTYAPRFKFESEHTAAVKALAWCPWQRHILASGGGTADRTIKIWNTSAGENLKSVDTGSQVCAIQWSDHHFKELVSSHGFSDYQLIVWRYQDMTKVQELRGHTARILNLAKSPDGRTVCSASADETLRFWDIFDRSTLSANSRTSLSPMNSPMASRGKSLSPKPPTLSMGGNMMIR